MTNKIKLFKHSDEFYKKKFQEILRNIYLCYLFLKEDTIKIPSNNENMIRDILVDNYLNNDDIRIKTGLNKYSFNKETAESRGFADIKIEFKNELLPTNAYYIIECKRLDNKNTKGKNGLNAKYINEGIFRFISNHYSTNCGVNAMLGFVIQEMNIDENIDNLNFLMQNKIKKSTKQYIQKETFLPNYDYHYSSEHIDVESKGFTLYHIMLDFSSFNEIELSASNR
ncbi:MAG: hypothetical protein FWG98_05140 [Candidatus Cloacimonetes bacterium]|nr:hypothetical protein [Candidatus Cloacimonadota bacterium]